MRGAVRIVPAVVTLLLLALPAGATAPSHYLPQANDRLSYVETVTLTNGHGTNYSGYSENSVYAGSINVTAVAPNGTVSAVYAASGTYRNNTGGSYPWSESGSFGFSPATYLYVGGTDNQTGYTNPAVWFYINNSLGVGASFRLLDTLMTVQSRDARFDPPGSSLGAVVTIFGTGSGSYQRHDAYGTFTAVYTWDAYFDPGTGYVVGYVYTENDSATDGNGFTYTDTLTDTSTSFPLTAAASTPSLPAELFVLALALGFVLVVVVIVAVLAWVLVRRRRGSLGRAPLPRHAVGSTAAPPYYGPPPPIHLTPDDQPRVQQIVLQETVKVPCRFCGTLIDSTATVCPKCGGPRT